MRIGLVTWAYSAHEGISRCVVELSRRLAVHHEVRVIASRQDSPAPPGVVVERLGLRTPWFFLAEWEFFVRAGAALRKQRHDLVHLHFPAWIPAQVFTCHGIARCALRSMRRFPPGPRQDVALPKMWPYYIQLPLYSFHLRNRRTLVAAVSQKARREVMTEYGRGPDDVKLIANGVDLHQFHPRLAADLRAPVRGLLGLGPDQFVLLFVGNHFRHKGLRYAIETLAGLPTHVALLVVGAGGVEDVPDPHRLLPRLLAQRRVLFAGVDHEVWRYYAAADALIFPSLYESFGLVVLEAMAAGLPVVTARTVGLAEEAIRDGENGFLVDGPWEVEGMRTRVRALLEDPGMAGRMGVRARETAEGYSWDRYADLTQAAYRHAQSSDSCRRARAVLAGGTKRGA